jgi:hypothetical protein
MSARILCAVPAYGGHVVTQFYMSSLRMQEELTRAGMVIKFGTLGFPDIGEVRNIFTTIFYDRTDATHLLFIDSDMSFEPQMIIDMINFDQPIVGVIATKKKYPIEFVGRASVGDPKDPATFDGFMKVDGVGGGVLLISRECIGEMLRQMPDIIDPYPLDLHPASELIKAQGLNRLLRPFDAVVNHEIGRLSEDLSFSNRWLRCGGEVWANISHPIGHVGYHEFRASYGDFLKQQREQTGAPA